MQIKVNKNSEKKKKKEKNGAPELCVNGMCAPLVGPPLSICVPVNIDYAEWRMNVP